MKLEDRERLCSMLYNEFSRDERELRRRIVEVLTNLQSLAITAEMISDDRNTLLDIAERLDGICDDLEQ